MYRYFYDYAQEILGYEYTGLILLAGVVISTLTLIIMLTPNWRRRMKQAGESDGKLAIILCYFYSACKVGFGLLVLLTLCAMLHVQSGLMSERQGQVTQKNYDAVKTKWGIAHEIRQLYVSLGITQKITQENFAGGGNREVADASETFLEGGENYRQLSDETFTVKRDKENKIIDPLSISRRKVFLRRKILKGSAVTESNTKFFIKYNPRYLGGAGYAGYSYTATLGFTVVNKHPTPAQAYFSFALPGNGYGVFDNLSIIIDGSEQPLLDYEEGALKWSKLLAANATHEIRISYKSRGLDYLRYTPGNFLKSCKASISIDGFDAKRLNFPIGGMSPQNELKKIAGDKFTLNWDLSNAVTNYSIGVIIPSPSQPGFTAGRILREAPLGLLLLALTLAVSRYIINRKPNFTAIGLTLLLSYLGYALFAHLSDTTASFYTALSLSLLIAGFVCMIFWLLYDRFSFKGLQSMIIALIFCSGYPLAVFYKDYSGVVLNATYIALVFYLMILYVIYRKGVDTPQDDNEEL